MRLWALLLLLGALAPAAAFHAELREAHSGAASRFARRNFGMAREGTVELKYTITTQEEPSQTYAFVLNEAQAVNWYDPWFESSTRWVSYLCNLPSMARWRLEGSGNRTWVVQHPDRYSVFVAHCSETGHTEWDLSLDLKNPTPEGDVSQHLGIDEVMFPTIYGAFMALYIAMSLSFFAECAMFSNNVKVVHHAMLAVVLARAFEMALLCVQYQIENEYGEVSNSFQTFVAVVVQIRLTIMLFTLQLVCMGWSITREIFRVRDIGSVVVVSALYLLLGILAVPCELELQTSGCSAIQLGLYALHFLIILAIIVAVNFSYTQFRAVLNDVGWTADVSLQYLQMKQYQMLRSVLFSYLLSPLIVYIIQVTMLSWKDTWILGIINELIELVVFLHIGTTFRPLKRSLVTRTFDNSLATQAS